MIGDILAKLGKGETLTIEEQQRIRLWGNQVDNNNAYIAGIQSGMGNISADNIYGRSFYVGREQFSGLACKFINDGMTVPNNTLTIANLDITVYNDGYPFDGQVVTIPTTGFYNITMDTTFGSNAVQSKRILQDDSSYIYVIATALSGESLTLTGSTDVLLTTGATVYMKLFQDTGGNLDTLRSSMTIRKIR